MQSLLGTFRKLRRRPPTGPSRKREGAALALWILIGLTVPADVAGHPQQTSADDAPFSDLLEGLEPLQPAATAPGESTEKTTDAAAATEAGRTDPLTAARRAMQQAGDRLGQGQLDESTAGAQQQALDHLDAFLAAMQSQQTAGAPTPTQSRQQATGETDDAAAAPPEPSQQAADGQQTEASTTAGSRPGTAPAEDDLAEGLPPMPADLDQAIWGHLPERMRRQLQAAMPEDFLPAYRQSIRDYFQRLTELQDDGP